MDHHQIHIDQNQLVISARKTTLFIRLVLSIILTAISVIPLAVTFVSLTKGKGPHIGIFFSFLLCWGVGFYLLRIILWNWVGKEILTLNSGTITYIADYGLFKDAQKEIATHAIEANIIDENESEIPLGRLLLRNELNTIETVLPAAMEELEKARAAIQTRYT